MNFDLILKGLFVISLLTECVVEVIKKLITEKRPTLTALIVSVVLSVGITVIYIVYNNIQMNAQIGCTIAVFIFFSFLVSTIGYDKLKEIILQIKEGKTNE